MTLARALTSEGLHRFEAYLGRLRDGAKAEPPHELLEQREFSRALEHQVDVEATEFKTRLDAARYLTQAMKEAPSGSLEANKGLWAWLSLFYFGQLCPPGADGRRDPGQTYRLISSQDWKHYHRHLVLGPVRIYSICGEMGRSMLSGPFSSHGDFAEQLASRQELIVNPGVIGLVDRLYFDAALGRTKPGATDRKKAGNLRRLIALVNQLDLTYDLHDMEVEGLVSLLPEEFARWLG